nr:uncharacterized protein LOC115264309 [Aedes albopictus]
MQTINTVQTTTLTVELRIDEMQETYNILQEHKIKLPVSDMVMSYHLEKRWRKLFNSALYRANMLQSTKTKFAEMTQNEISIFCLEVSIPSIHPSTFIHIHPLLHTGVHT